MPSYDEIMKENLPLGNHINNQQYHYHSFLLRIWQTQGTTHAVWHFSLENPLTHEIKPFQDVQSLSGYLTQLMDITQVEVMK